jgi:prepilin-type N-terminal cleavage/methylation domain-containing protein
MYKNLLKEKNTTAGFTLVEMLLTLSILVILVAMIIPSFGKVGGQQALDTTVMSIVSVLNAAKSSAISSTDAQEPSVKYGVGIYSNRLISYNGLATSSVSISNLVTISTSTGIGSEIIFNNVSGSTNSNGTITVTVVNDSTKKSVITIYPTGVIEKN